jgi:hypothetical protein
MPCFDPELFICRITDYEVTRQKRVGEVHASHALCDVYDVRDMPEASGPFSYVPVILPYSCVPVQ